MHWLPGFARLRIYWAAALAACIGVAVSFAAFHGARLFSEDQLRADLTQQAALRARGLQEVLSHYEGTIDGFAASFPTDHVTSAEFDAYAHNVYLASHLLGTGFKNVSWEPRVRDAERASFEAAAQADGFPGYRIRDLAPDGTLVPAARREQYFPIRYFDPMVASAPLGLDVMGSGTRAAATRDAIEKRMPIATAPLRFISGGRGCVIYVPVFKPGPVDASSLRASERLVGFLSFRLLISAAIDSVMDALQPVPQGVDMYMLDDGAAPSDRLFYARLALQGSVTVDPDDAPSALVEPYSGSSFDFAGRDWTVIVRPTPAMLASRITWAGWRELSIGLALTALLTAYLISSRNRADRLRVLASSLRQEIVERERAEERIIHSARHDFLTGLPNRMLFLERLKQEIARAKRGEKSFAVLYLDLDRFKDINDTLGHQMGDLLLKAVADRLSEGVRDIDTVARLGGDEFAVIQTGLQDATDAAILSNKLLELLHRPFRLGDQDIHTDASIGTAVYTVSSGDEQATLVHADLAMYKAKAEGGGRFCFHLPEMEEEVRARATLTEELRSGIERDELALYYQPLVDLKTGTVAGIEALVRWRHPKRELLLPGAFLGEAERSGLIFDLDARVLREACRQGRAWLDSGIAPGVISVNVASATLKRGTQYLQLLEETLRETGYPPERLELELADAAFVATTQAHRETLEGMRRLAIKLVIDDFGVGYSSLEYLRLFPVDRIKLARGLVAGLATEANSAAIAETIIKLAAALSIKLVAVGVEFGEQVEFLRTHGCAEAQGFYFSAALPPERAAALIRGGRLYARFEEAAPASRL
ncbi:MAG TPA: EAL domain-containing protein [Alphaproteobacteria bacterium]|nr:EAL domain-containing protein [Alphaproteobacteria bacterium]